MSSRYDDFKRLQAERRERESDAVELGRLVGKALIAYFTDSSRCRLFEKDTPETWSDDWVRAELLGFLTALLGRDKGVLLKSFGKGDFPARSALPLRDGHDHEAT